MDKHPRQPSQLEIRCSYCKSKVDSKDDLLDSMYCSLPCQGKYLKTYTHWQRHRYDVEEEAYYDWLMERDDKYRYSTVDLCSPNKYIRRAAERYLKRINHHG